MRPATRTRTGPSSPTRPLRRLVSTVGALAVFAGAGVVTTAPASAAPDAGRVLSTEAIAGADLPSGAASGTRLTYVTRDQNGRPAISTGVVYIPSTPAPTGGRRIFSWAHGTTGIADECAPSRTRKGDGVDAPIRDALRSGYAVTATDYAGLGSAGETEYLGGKAAAHSVLDLIRAARARDASLSADWVSVGHSQGGHAALFAGHEAPSYAPELRLREIVAFAPASGVERLMAGVFTPDVPSLGKLNVVSALFLYILAGLDHARPDLHVTDHLTADGKRYLDLARSACNGEVSEAMRSVAPGALLDSSLRTTEFTDALTDYMSVPTSGYPAPIRIDHGVLDPVVPYTLTASLVRSMRSAGTAVDLHTHLRADHTDVVTKALGEVIGSVSSAFGRD